MVLPLERGELLRIAHNPQDVTRLKCEISCGGQIIVIAALHCYQQCAVILT